MHRLSLRIWLTLILLSSAPQLARAQTALENLERQLPPPAASSPAGAPDAAAGAVVEEPGYLGIVADETGDGRGVRLIEVFPEGPAAAAGMRTGDVLQSIEGGTVATLDELGTSLSRRVAGERLAMVVIRGVDALRLDVVLAKRPPPDQRRYPNFGRLTGDGNEPIVIEPPRNAAPSTGSLPAGTPPGPPAPGTVADPDTLPPPQSPSGDPVPVPGVARGAPPRMRPGLLGVRVVRVTPELQLAMNLPEPRGALIVEVHPDSPARKAGLPVDAVIVAANGRRVEDPDQLAEIVGQIGDGGSLRVTYYRYGQSFERVVELKSPAPEGVAVPDPSPPPAAVPLNAVPPNAVPPIAVPPAAIPPAAAPPSGPTLGPPPGAARPPAPKSVADENERLKARIAELEAQLKAAQNAANPK